MIIRGWKKTCCVTGLQRQITKIFFAEYLSFLFQSPQIGRENVLLRTRSQVLTSLLAEVI